MTVSGIPEADPCSRGFDVHLSDILEDYAKKMRDAENEPHDGKRKVESVW